MSTYTPGPWTCRESALSRHSDLWFIDGTGPDEADMRGEARAPRVAEAWTEANAHLIAAAPDLYEALKEASEELVLYRDSPLRLKIDAALSKAEGTK